MGWLADEVEARRSIGIEVELLEAAALKERFSLHRPGAIHSPAAMEVDPYRLTLGLLDVAVRKGARVFAKTNVEIECPSSGPHVLRAEHGPRIEPTQRRET